MTRLLQLQRKKKDEGVILILAMLVVLVLACVVVQLFFTTSANREIARQQRMRYPMAMAARGALLQSEAVLIQDVENQSSTGEESGGDMGGELGSGGSGTGSGEGGNGSGGGGEGFGQGGQSGEGGGLGADTSDTDSLVDEWARPGAVSVVTSNDLDVTVLIRDEDAKFNILSAASDDEDFANASHERLVRLIDTFREDTTADVSRSTAEKIVDSIEEWIKGNRDTDRFPKPNIKTGKEDLDQNRLEKEVPCLPLTIDEIQMCPGMTPEILYGFMDQGKRIPGLIEFITCYSNLAFDSIPRDEDEKAGEDPFNGGNQGGEEGGSGGGTGTGEGGSGSGEGTGEEPEQVETNNGRVNINTAPLPVLRALMDESEIPTSVLEKIIEFRKKAIDVYEESERRAGDFGNSSGSNSGSGSSGENGEEDEDFIFRDPSEVIQRVEDYFDTHFDLGKDVEEEFASLLSVTSHVFTVYVSVRPTEGKGEQNFRAVIWRWSGQDAGSGEEGGTGSESGTGTGTDTGGARIITLVPLEEYPFPLPLTPEEEEVLQNRY